MDRIEQMKKLKRKGLSYQSIGELFNISRQRVHQLISGYITPSARKKNGKYNWAKVLFQSILKRDDFICQKCFGKANFVHHIDKDNYNNNPSNLISICNKCHLELHRPNFNGKKLSERHKRNIGKANTKERINKICLNCKKEFEVLPSVSKQIYCSKSCNKLHFYKNSWKIKKCKNCKKEIRYLPSQWEDPLYCSYKCFQGYRKEKADKQAIKIYKLFLQGIHYKKIAKYFDISQGYTWTLRRRGEKLVKKSLWQKIINLIN